MRIFVGGRWQAHLSRKAKIAFGLCASVFLARAGDLAAHQLPAPTPTATKASATITVSAGKPTELSFKLSTKKVAIGKVTFKVTNQGRLPHTFELYASPQGRSPTTCKGKTTPRLAPGK